MDVRTFEVPESPVPRPIPRTVPENPLDFQPQSRRPPAEEDDEEQTTVLPHRGALLLTMAILTVFLVCCPVVALVIGGIGENMAGKDLRMMALNKMDRSGRGLTHTSRTIFRVGIAFSLIIWTIFLILRVLR